MGLLALGAGIAVLTGAGAGIGIGIATAKATESINHSLCYETVIIALLIIFILGSK